MRGASRPAEARAPRPPRAPAVLGVPGMPAESSTEQRDDLQRGDDKGDDAVTSFYRFVQSA
jgi:hypothetical protein